MTELNTHLKSGFVLDGDRIPEIKRQLWTRLGKVKNSHRLEIFARCVGFRTYASLRAVLNDGPVTISEIDTAPGIEFCTSKDIDLTAGELSSCLEGLVDHLGEGAARIPANR